MYETNSLRLEAMLAQRRDKLRSAIGGEHESGASTTPRASRRRGDKILERRGCLGPRDPTRCVWTDATGVACAIRRIGDHDIETFARNLGMRNFPEVAGDTADCLDAVELGVAANHFDQR